MSRMTHEERARFASARHYERMQEEGLLPYDGEAEDARKARRAAVVAGYRHGGPMTDPANDNQLTHLFAYHAPSEEQTECYCQLRLAALEFARVIDRLCPAGPDRTAAIRKLREAVMTANAAIATGGGAYR